MQKRPGALLLVVLAAVFPALGQGLDLGEALTLAEQNDLGSLQSESAYRTAVLSRQAVESALLPQVSVSATPGYSLAGASDFPLTEADDPENPLATSLNLGIDLIQALPSDGSLSLGLSNTSTVTRSGDDIAVAQAPSATLSLAQPVWVNGRPLDLRLFGARRRVAAELPVLRAAEGRRQARNTVVIAVANTYKEVYSLRRRLAQLDVNLFLTEKSLQQMRVREDQGSVTATDVWELEIELNLLYESRLELGYALLQAEAALAASLGFDTVATRALDGAIPDLQIPADLSGFDLATASNVRSARWDLEESQLNQIIDGRQDGGNFTASLSLSPSYDPLATPVDGRTWSESISDLTADGASLDYALSFGFTMPVFDGGQARTRRAIASLAEADASVRVTAAQRTARTTLEALVLRRNLVEDRISYLEGSLEFGRRRLAESETRYALDQITTQDLERARLRVSEDELTLWESKMDYLVNALELLDWQGVDLFDVLAAGGVE